MHEVPAEGLIRDFFLIPVPEKDVFARLDEVAAEGPYEIQRGPGVKGASRDIVRGVGNPLLREKLPRLGAGGSAVPIVQVQCRHSRGPEKNSPLARRPEG
jgi:hypothetical protein